MDEPIPNILTRESQERFRRKLSIASRIIAIMLIGAIVFIGFIQIQYAKDIGALKDKYGSLASCYLCGQENLRKCECQYIPQLLADSSNISAIAEQTARNNVLRCPNVNSQEYKLLQYENITKLVQNITIDN